MFKLHGVVPPMITPFKESGELDTYNLQKLVEYLSEYVDGLFICGSYGSGALMSVAERKQVAEIVKKSAKNNVLVVVHTGTTNTRDTIELTLHAREIGCNAASAVGPYYYKYADADLINYYSDILHKAKDFPFYVYQNPGFQGYETSLKVLKTLKQIGLCGVKDATFDVLKHAVYIRELADENFDISLGTEAMWISAHALGCKSFIPGIGNVFPEMCKKMWQLSMDGNASDALELQFIINKLRDIMYYARSTQLAVYAIAEIKGIISAFPRAPFIPATEAEKSRIKQALLELKVI